MALLDYDCLARWDPLVHKVTVVPGSEKDLQQLKSAKRKVYEPDWDERWLHIEYKCVPPTLQRDMVVRQIWGKVNDTLVILWRSGEHPDVPSRMWQGVVRAESQGSGIVIQLVKENRVIVSWITHVDTKGADLPVEVAKNLGIHEPLVVQGAKTELEAARVA